jgi:hypothetical protein
MVALSNLEYAKQVLLSQLEMINTATQENWASVRAEARKSLEEATQRLREVE